jgi:hypothetical protein
VNSSCCSTCRLISEDEGEILVMLASSLIMFWSAKLIRCDCGDSVWIFVMNALCSCLLLVCFLRMWMVGQ